MCIPTVLCHNFSKIAYYSYMYLCLYFLDLHYATQLMIHFHIEDSLIILP